jgi:hypothetical protein
MVRSAAPVTAPHGGPLIVDQWGRGIDPFAPPKDPLIGAEAGAGVIYRDIPLVSIATGNWDIGGIRGALADHMVGLFQTSAQLCDAVFGDERVQATLGSRTGGLFSQKLIHDVTRDDHNHRKVRRAWRKAWKRLMPQSVASEIMRWAVMMGFAVCEVIWDTSVTPWQPTLKVWHPMFIYYRWDLRRYVAMTQDGPVIIEPGNGKWFLFTPHGPYRGWAQGAVRATADKWFIKQLAWRDWARFNERHGLPIIKAYVPASGDAGQKQQFVLSMAGLGQQAVVGLPQNVDQTGYDLELLEARDRAWESFQGTIDRCDRSLLLPIIWQNLTTEVKEGSLAAARVHGDVRQNAIEFDDATLSEAVYEQLARPFALFNFGDAELATYTHWDVEPVEDFNVKADVLLKVGQALNQLRQAGVAVNDVRKLARQFGLSVGRLHKVDPVQVEARLAQATGTDKPEPESNAAIFASLRSMRRKVARIEARLAA